MMSQASGRIDQPRRNLVVVPARWTQEQLDFLRFLFPLHPTPVPAVATTCSHGAKPSSIRQDLSRNVFAHRHLAISELFEVPGYGYGVNKMLPLRFRRRRRFAEIDCVVFSPRQTHPRKARVAAYVDEGCIYYFQQRTRSSPPTQPIKPREYHPYIAALLIALAQTIYRGEEVDHVETSVLFSENPRGFSKEPVREFHLYSASIPLTLLKFFQRPKATLPAYDTISVTCLSIPIEPLASLRERIVMAMPDSALDQQTEDEMIEQLETHPSNSPPVESRIEY